MLLDSVHLFNSKINSSTKVLFTRDIHQRYQIKEVTLMIIVIYYVGFYWVLVSKPMLLSVMQCMVNIVGLWLLQKIPLYFGNVQRDKNSIIFHQKHLNSTNQSMLFITIFNTTLTSNSMIQFQEQSSISKTGICGNLYPKKSFLIFLSITGIFSL